MEMSEVAFSGKITAAFTHEMKNVLAIIKEAAGLMEDLLLMSRDVPFPHRERFARAIGTIGEQVTRGVELSNRLNRFAHSSDEPAAVVDLNALAGQFAGLVHRFPRLKNVILAAAKPEEGAGASIFVSPVRLQMGLFAAAACCWNNMPAGGEILLAPSMRGEMAAIGLLCRGELGERDDFIGKVSADQGWDAAMGIIRSLSGTLEWDGAEFGFHLIFPPADLTRSPGGGDG
jgi:hypothetical protein